MTRLLGTTRPCTLDRINTAVHHRRRYNTSGPIFQARLLHSNKIESQSRKGASLQRSRRELYTYPETCLFVHVAIVLVAEKLSFDNRSSAGGVVSYAVNGATGGTAFHGTNLSNTLIAKSENRLGVWYLTRQTVERVEWFPMQQNAHRSPYCIVVFSNTPTLSLSLTHTHSPARGCGCGFGAR